MASSSGTPTLSGVSRVHPPALTLQQCLFAGNFVVDPVQTHGKSYSGEHTT